MKRKIFWVGLVCLLVNLSQLATADEGFEIVVTGSRISRSDMYDMPAVTLTKQADFLVQEIRLVNDSRDPNLRKKEIIESINGMMSRGKKLEGIELSYGQGFLVPVKLDDESLQLIEDQKKRDTSYIDLYVKIRVNNKQSAKQQIAQLRQFISQSKMISRTEVELRGDIGLSVINPDQYRFELLGQIAQDNQKVQRTIGNSCEVTLDGLEGRVMWERTDILELSFYIGYATSVTCR